MAGAAEYVETLAGVAAARYVETAAGVTVAAAGAAVVVGAPAHVEASAVLPPQSVAAAKYVDAAAGVAITVAGAAVVAGASAGAVCRVLSSIRQVALPVTAASSVGSPVLPPPRHVKLRGGQGGPLEVTVVVLTFSHFPNGVAGCIDSD